MNAPGREAGTESSKDEPARRRRPALPSVPRLPSVLALRALLALAGIAGCVLLVLATSATVIEIRVLTTTELAAPIDTEQSGWERHGPALLLLAGLGFLMLLGALRGARPAMLAVVVAGVAALGIALVWDLPDLDDTRGAEELYEGAEAGPESGYYLETAGGALLLVSGGGLFLLAGRPARRREEEQPAADEADWFAEA